MIGLEAGDFSSRFWNERMDSVTERCRDSGRSAKRGEDWGIEWIMALSEGFEDLRLSLTTAERKSSAVDWRRERTRFSSAIEGRPSVGLR